MPAYEQLRAAIRARTRRLLFAYDRMAHEVEPLLFSQRPLPRDVVTLHRCFTQIMSERGQTQRRAIRAPQAKEPR